MNELILSHLGQLGLIATMLALVWLVTRNLWIDVPNRERRSLDYIGAYNQTEDRTETMFDRRIS